MSSPDYSSLVTQLQNLSQKPPEDAVSRRHISAAVKEATLALETPLETVRRIAFAPLQITVAKIAIDLGIFELLSISGRNVALEELVTATRAERGLLVRILRYLAAADMIAANPDSTYAAISITHTLARAGFRAGIEHHFEAQLPAWIALPSFLASTSYSCPVSAASTAFQIAHSTPLPAFHYAATKPKLMRDFATWMGAQREGVRTWLDAFDVENEIIGQAEAQADTERPLFVDVGGGSGQQCQALRARVPDLKRQIVLQDLPQVVALAGKLKGVEVMAHDFWCEQPVKGASFYYIRNVLHDHQNDPCVTILRKIKDAMAPNSTILIDELVLPETMEIIDKDVGWMASLDIGLMASLAGRERTEQEWRVVVEEAGLRIKETREYDREGNAVIVVVQL